MPIIEIEITKILKIEQEFLLEKLIQEFVQRIDVGTAGLKVLSFNQPRLRKENKNGGVK